MRLGFNLLGLIAGVICLQSLGLASPGRDAAPVLLGTPPGYKPKPVLHWRHTSHTLDLDRLVKLRRAQGYPQHELAHYGGIVEQLKGNAPAGAEARAMVAMPDLLRDAYRPAKPPVHRDFLGQEGPTNPSMPAFRRLVRRITRGRPLVGFKVVGIQHLVSNTGGLVRAIANAGVHPGELSLMGKVYSQSEEAMGDLRREGFRMEAARWESANDIEFGHYGVSRPPTDLREHELLQYLDQMFQRRPSLVPNGPLYEGNRQAKYLVLDDGGDLIRLIHEYYPEMHDRVVAVEQTRAGIRKVEQLGVKFPVIDVAQSFAKLEHESPMIGRALAKMADRRLSRISAQGFDVGKKVLLVGYGAVGQMAAASLAQKGYTVEVYDTKPEAIAAARAAGLIAHAEKQAALSGAKIVLSTTGTVALEAADFEHLAPGAVIMNGASSSTEFMPDMSVPGRRENLPAYRGDVKTGQLVTNLLGRPFEMGRWKRGNGQQLDLVVRTASGKEYVLVNQGQVINFDQGKGVIPPKYIQLTIGLLYSAALQAARTDVAGIHALEEAPQRHLLRDVEADLAKDGASLANPSF